MQGHGARSTATLYPFQCPTNEEGLQRRCLQISSQHQQVHGPVQSGYWQPTHQSNDATNAHKNAAIPAAL